jgi:hypothetical protein
MPECGLAGHGVMNKSKVEMQVYLVDGVNLDYCQFRCLYMRECATGAVQVCLCATYLFIVTRQKTFAEIGTLYVPSRLEELFDLWYDCLHLAIATFGDHCAARNQAFSLCRCVAIWNDLPTDYLLTVVAIYVGRSVLRSI